MSKPVICLDTSVLIDYFRKNNKENTYFYKLMEEYDDFAITSITEYEILYAINEEQKNHWYEMIENMEIFPFDSSSCKLATDIQKKQKYKGKSLNNTDLFTAAIAINNDARLATFNEQNFETIDNLNLL